MKNTTATITDGKITDLRIDGKKAKAGFMRGLRKAQETSYWSIPQGESYQAQNQFSGVTVELDKIEAAVYNWCMNWYSRYSMGMGVEFTEAPVQTFDDMKYLLMNINAEAYYNLLD